ncbi:DUF2188 domain-containing protein [Gaopeijia maritima]|uniref:DUF2188 domain-containing protein n=1 Tax=Gaopeijia maritima TaxID=3119007 RepID=A0ABU9E6C2_9BACT
MRTSTMILAGTAALAAAVAATALPRRSRSSDGILMRVTPDGDRWGVRVDDQDVDAFFDTKRQAVREARTRARNQAPSRLVIHRADGTIERSHGYGDE